MQIIDALKTTRRSQATRQQRIEQMYRIILSTAFALFFTSGPSFSQVIEGEAQMQSACISYPKSEPMVSGS